MPTLTPTKADGATAKANDVIYVEPAHTTTDEELAEALAIDGLNAAFVADLLSAHLTHERCGTHLYRSVAGRTNNPVLRARYEEFGEETLRHVEILEDVVRSAGGNPAYVSPLARAVEAADAHALQATFLAAGGLDPMAQEMAMLDAVFMAESIDHANWEALGQLVPKLPEGSLREKLRAAVDEVEVDEDEHLSWARDTRAQLTMLQASSSFVAKAGAKAEELVATVKRWFSGNGSSVPGATTSRSTTKRSTTKRSTAKKAPTKRAPAKRSTGKKASTKRAPAKKSAAKTSTATKRAPAKKSTAKRSTAKRSTAKKAGTDKTAARRSAATRPPAKRAAAKKTSTAKRAAARR